MMVRTWKEKEKIKWKKKKKKMIISLKNVGKYIRSAFNKFPDFFGTGI